MPGKKELVLYYRPQGTPSPAKLKGVLVRMGIRIRNIQEEQLKERIGFLAGMEGYAEAGERKGGEEPSKEGLSQELLVMYQFTNARLEEFLGQLRRAGVPRIDYKAVVTETNAAWTLRELYQELAREHEAVMRQREAAKKAAPGAGENRSSMDRNSNQ